MLINILVREICQLFTMLSFKVSNLSENQSHLEYENCHANLCTLIRRIGSFESQQTFDMTLSHFVIL